MSRACREAVRSTLYIRAEPRFLPFFRRGGEEYFPDEVRFFGWLDEQALEITNIASLKVPDLDG